MNNKYELTEKSIYVPSHKVTLYQIKALQDFYDVEAGDLGGFIEKEENLSHEGFCWVYDHAQVFNHAVISGNAIIAGHAKVFDFAKISGDVMINDFAEVCNYSKIKGSCKIFNFARIIGHSNLSGSMIIREHPTIYTEGHMLTDDDNEYSPYHLICEDIIFKSNPNNIAIGQERSTRIYNNAQVYNDAQPVLETSKEFFDNKKYNELEKKIRDMQMYIDKLELRINKIEKSLS